MPDVRIEPATERDVPLVLAFVRELAEYERLLDKVVATEALVRDTLFGPGRSAEAIIAYREAEPVGFAVFFHTYSTFLGRRGMYLEDLFVRPEARGQGVGRALLARVARLARERGCGRMEWAVLDWNEPAIRFYRGLGAEPMHEWTVYRLTGDALAHVAAADS